MTVEELLETYTGGAYITIHGYCTELDIDDLFERDSYDDVKERMVESWNIIGGDGMYRQELMITLANV